MDRGAGSRLARTAAASLPLGPHPGLADKLAVLKSQVAEVVTDAFFRQHPDWVARYGDRGRLRGVEDAGFHIDFLAGALESQSVAAFEDYVLWTTRLLAARGISPLFVAENLQQIAAALQPHLSEDEWAAVTTTVSAGCAVCTGELSIEPPRAAQEMLPDGLGESGALFLQMILKGQRREAFQVALETLRAGYPVVDIYTGIFQASLYRVGELWETNMISVAQEHMATAITQHVLAQLYAHLPPVTLTRGRIVLAGVQGELHQVGATMVADGLEADGWDVRFLGSNMPHIGILQALDDHAADILAISATMLFNLPRVRTLVAEVRARFGRQGPRIVGGGGAFRSLPSDGAALGITWVASDLHSASTVMQAALDERPPP